MIRNDRLLAWYCGVSVCLSVTKGIMAKRTRYLGSDLLRTRFYNFQTTTLILSPQTPTPCTTHVGAIWRINYNHSANKRIAEISTSGIALVNMLYGYSRQRRTIGSFSATAGQLVTVHLDVVHAYNSAVAIGSLKATWLYLKLITY